MEYQGKTFNYTIDPNSDEPIMLLNKEIGGEMFSDSINGAEFQAELFALDGMGKKRIQVYINSPGGMVTDGMNIYNAILKSKTKVDTYCVGIAASIAGVIFQAGRKRYMSDYGSLMYHNATGGDDKALDAVNESLCKMITSRSGKATDDVAKMMKKTTFINAEEALATGLCDCIEYSNDLNKPRRITDPNQNVKMAWAEANKILNNAFQNQKSMKKVLESLGLKEGATEEEITNALAAHDLKIKNEAEAAITASGKKDKKKDEDTDEPGEEVKNISKQLQTVSDTLKTTADALKAVQDSNKEMKAKLDEQDKTEARVKAKAMVAKYINRLGAKPTPEVVTGWEEKAVSDLAGTEKLLAALPLNVKALNLENFQNELKDGDIPNVMQAKMASIAVAHKQY